VVIPAKALPEAKSRLLPAAADPAAHRALVQAIRADSLAAAQAAADVARVLLVVDRPDGTPGSTPGTPGGTPGTPGGELVLVQTRPGLNAALAEAAEHAAVAWPADGVAALVGDLPALQPAELAAALAEAAGHPRAFVPDAAGTGTTLLTAGPGTELWPRFGPGSAARHRADAVELAAGPGLRHDVDTAEDLRSAAALRLGPATAAVVARSGITGVQLDGASLGHGHRQ
jgi:2-phospho-L-lactate/phosphoenolpyruvate guanylyltransferase